MNDKAFYYPFFNSGKEVIKELLHAKYLTNKIFYISLFSYLVGLYDIFIMTVPIIILIFFGFILLIFINYQPGNEEFKKLTKEKKDNLIEKYKTNFKTLRLLLFIYHLIPLFLAIYGLQKIKEIKGVEYLQKNYMYYVLSSNVLLLICICFTDRNIYGNFQIEWTTIMAPILILILIIKLFNL